MTIYIPLEVPLWLALLVGGYVASGLAIALACWRDGGAAHWSVGNWIGAIVASPIVVLEVWIEDRAAGHRDSE